MDQKTSGSLHLWQHSVCLELLKSKGSHRAMYFFLVPEAWVQLSLRGSRSLFDTMTPMHIFVTSPSKEKKIVVTYSASSPGNPLGYRKKYNIIYIDKNKNLLLLLLLLLFSPLLGGDLECQKIKIKLKLQKYLKIN